MSDLNFEMLSEFLPGNPPRIDLEPPPADHAIRFDDPWSVDGTSPPYRLLYRIVRETPKGFWIDYLTDYRRNPTIYGREKFVLNSTPGVIVGVEKRFCYRDPLQALESYRIRKLRQIAHARAAIERAEICLSFVDAAK